MCVSPSLTTIRGQPAMSWFSPSTMESWGWNSGLQVWWCVYLMSRLASSPYSLWLCVSCLSEVYVWRSEDLQESVFSFHLDTGDWTQVIRLIWQVLLSALPTLPQPTLLFYHLTPDNCFTGFPYIQMTNVTQVWASSHKWKPFTALPLPSWVELHVVARSTASLTWERLRQAFCSRHLRVTYCHSNYMTK